MRSELSLFKRNFNRSLWTFFLIHSCYYKPIEKGGDPVHNSKLEGLILKAKSSSMPKDRIENSIKNAIRVIIAFFDSILIFDFHFFFS